MLNRLRVRRAFARVGLLVLGTIATLDAQDQPAPRRIEPRVPIVPGRPSGPPGLNQPVPLLFPGFMAGPRCMRSVPVLPNTDRGFLLPIPNNGAGFAMRQEIMPPCVPIALSPPAVPNPRVPEPVPEKK